MKIYRHAHQLPDLDGVERSDKAEYQPENGDGGAE